MNLAPLPYTRVERLLHRVAVAGVPLQLALAELEQRVYHRRLSAVAVERPVFVAGLPRAGTTLVLELLSRLPEFATHTYRHMPFVLCPLLWDTVSRPFRRASRLRERAHGDGVRIGYDSPEAFEEVVWKAHWPDKYLDDRIEPWSWSDRNPAFEAFLRRHMCSILALRQRRGGGPRRYLSKNNANIARIGLLLSLFPDCRIVIPVREPRSHVASLLRQQHRFLELQQRDVFARRYMESLGHHEFGLSIKPLDLGGWLGDAAARDPLQRRFWLQYWYHAYSAVLKAAAGNVVLLDYDALCRAPAATLRELARALDVESDGELIAQLPRVRPPTAYPRGADPGNDADLLQCVQRLYRQLRIASVGGIRGVA